MVFKGQDDRVLWGNKRCFCNGLNGFLKPNTLFQRMLYHFNNNIFQTACNKSKYCLYRAQTCSYKWDPLPQTSLKWQLSATGDRNSHWGLIWIFLSFFFLLFCCCWQNYIPYTLNYQVVMIFSFTNGIKFLKAGFKCSSPIPYKPYSFCGR